MNNPANGVMLVLAVYMLCAFLVSWLTPSMFSPVIWGVIGVILAVALPVIAIFRR